MENNMFKKLTMILAVMMMFGSASQAHAYATAYARTAVIDDKDTQVVYYPTNVDNIELVNDDMRNFISSMVFNSCKGQFKDVDSLTVRGVMVDKHSTNPETLSTLVRIGIEVKWKAELKKDHDVISMSIVQEDDFVMNYQDISLVFLGSTTGITCR